MSFAKITLAACVAGLSLSLAAPTHAADPAKGQGGKGHEEMLKKFDKNGNGKLDADEMEAMKAERGKGRPEGAGKGQGGGKGREEMLKKFDKNGNGKLDPDEMEAAKAERAKNRPEGAGKGQGGGKMREEMLKKFDKNGNGKLDPDEMEAAKAERGKNRPAGDKPAGKPRTKPAEKKPE